MSALLLASLCLSTTLTQVKPTTNPLGFVYDLPKGWTVAATQDTYQLIKRPGQTENEVFLIGGSIDFEAKTSWDKRLQDEDEAMMTKLGPWSPVGDIQSFEAKGGKGMYRLFEATTQGVEFQSQVWSLLSEKKRFGIFAVYPKDQASARYADFFAIAKSLRPDPNRKISTNNDHAKTWSQILAGHRLTRSSANNSGSLNGAAGDSGERSFTFLPDGTFRYAARTMTFISAGEFSSSSVKNEDAIGTWAIESDGKQAYLILKPVGKPSERVPLKQSGAYILLNNRPFSRVKA